MPMSDDWRVHAILTEPEHAGPMMRALHEHEVDVERDLHKRLGDKLPVSNDRKTEAQLKMRACFKAASLAWSQLPTGTRSTWPVYWQQWLHDHPECKT